MLLHCEQNPEDHDIYADRYKTPSLFLPNIQHHTLQIPLILFRQESTRTMQFLYVLLPLIPLAAANGRIRFTSFDHPGCAGFEETYDLNPAPVKGNFSGKIQHSSSDCMF